MNLRPNLLYNIWDVVRIQSDSQLFLASWPNGHCLLCRNMNPLNPRGERYRLSLVLWRTCWQWWLGELPFISPTTVGYERISSWNNSSIVASFCIVSIYFVYILYLFNKPNLITEIPLSLPICKWRLSSCRDCIVPNNHTVTYIN